MLNHNINQENKPFKAMVAIMKNALDNFSQWISQLSWGKFIIFIILTALISNTFQEFVEMRLDNNWIHTLTAIFIFVSFGMKVLMNSKVKAEQRAEKETLLRQLSEAKVQIMQAQIEPHFLFNTLSSLQYLIEKDPSKANQMLNYLVNYLRYAIPQIRENKAINNLGKEINNIKDYLNIMQIRIGERLSVEFQIPTQLEGMNFPSMMLQPIVENAIKYGIEESLNGGLIKIKAEITNSKLELHVIDTGEGFKSNNSRSGNGMSLINIKERLNILYHGQAQLIIKPNEPHGSIVTIQLPY